MKLRKERRDGGKDVDKYNSVIYIFAAKVQNVLIEIITLTSVNVSWDRLHFSEIAQYLVYYTQTAKRKIQVEYLVKVPATAGSVVISNLTSGRSYLFEVQAEVVLDGIVIVGPRSERNTVIFQELRGGSKFSLKKKNYTVSTYKCVSRYSCGHCCNCGCCHNDCHVLHYTGII